MKIFVLGMKREYKHWEVKIAELLSQKHEVFFTSRYDPEEPPWHPDLILQLMQLSLEKSIQFMRRYKAPIITYFTGADESLKLNKEIVKELDGRITWTNWGKKRLEEKYDTEFTVNPLGVNLEEMGNLENATTERKGFYTVAGDWNVKRVWILAENVDDLIIIGDGRLVEKYGATGYVSVKTKNEIRSKTKGLVHASIMEGFNLPALSALYFNNYLILYELQIYKEIYKDLIDKYVLLWRDVVELKKLVEEVKKKPNFYDGKDFILREELTLQEHVRRLEEVLP